MRKFFAILVTLLTVAGITVGIASPASASTVCTSWRTSTWGTARECVSSSIGEYVQYSDHGTADGHCVVPWVWNNNTSRWVDMNAPLDCTTSGYTVYQISDSDLGFHNPISSGLRLYRSDFGAYQTTCDGNNPPTDAPACID